MFIFRSELNRFHTIKAKTTQSVSLGLREPQNVLAQTLVAHCRIPFKHTKNESGTKSFDVEHPVSITLQRLCFVYELRKGQGL